MVAAAFTPGPFISPLWTATALATGLWVVAFGSTIAATRNTPATSA